MLSLAVILGEPLPAQEAAEASLGLLRLEANAKRTDAASVVSDKFTIDALSTTGVAGAGKAKKNNVEYLVLDAGKDWLRPLRGNGKDVTFVSFQVYASQTTIIEIAGARLGVTASPVGDGLQLMFDDSSTGVTQWKPLNYHLAPAVYDGKHLVALPTLTVRLDPGASAWDLYSGSRLLAADLPLIEGKKNDRQIKVQAGGEGAWIIGLVLADENPIFEDANANGIDDAFERQVRGSLLPATARKAERQALVKQWRDAQRTRPPPVFAVQRPMPDPVPGPR